MKDSIGPICLGGGALNIRHLKTILVRLEEVHAALPEDAELSVFLCVFIKFTNSPGSYVLLANRKGGTLTTTSSPVPVTLAIGSASGTAQVLFIISFLTHDRAMAAKQLQRTDIGSEIAWLLETDAGAARRERWNQGWLAWLTVEKSPI